MSSVLLDSNIIIYAAQPDDSVAAEYIETGDFSFVSEISLIEVLGFSGISDSELKVIESLLDESHLLPISRKIIDTAVLLRRARKMSLGDAIIAGTALIYQLPLVTRNIADFSAIAGLVLINPYPAQTR